MAKKKGGRKGRAARRDNSSEYANSASQKPKSAKSSDRTKAEDLSYDPNRWEAHKYIILAHFSATMARSALEGTIECPAINPGLASQLLTDVSRSSSSKAAPPDPPAAIPPDFWHIENEDEFARYAYHKMGDAAFISTYIPNEDETKDGYEPPKFDPIPPTQPFDVDPEYDYKTKFTSHAWTSLVQWHAKLTEYRAANPQNFLAGCKVQSYIKDSAKDPNGAMYYANQPAHIQFAIYSEINTLIYVFLSKYIGRTYKFLFLGIADNDGVSLFERLDLKQTKPSASSGQDLLIKIGKAHQLPGQEYSQYFQYVMDLSEEYESASGEAMPPSLVRLALTHTDRVNEFYKPILTSISADDSKSGTDTPLDGQGSIRMMILDYEKKHKKAFKEAMRRKKPRRRDDDEAHAANSNNQRNNQRNNRNNNGNRDRGQLTYTCTWCAKFRPGEPTSHNVDDCRIKADYVDMICQNCKQRGHPARLCPDKTGRANQADEDDDSRSTRSSSSSRSRRLRRPRKDLLFYADAKKALKTANTKAKKEGKKHRYVITQFCSDDDSQESD